MYITTLHWWQAIYWKKKCYNVTNKEFIDLRKLFVWENLNLWLFKISTGMYDENLRSMACIACHCWNGVTSQLCCHSNWKGYTLKAMHAMLLRFASCIPVLMLKSQRHNFSQTNNFSQIIKFGVYYASYNVQTSPVRCRKDCSVR